MTNEDTVLSQYVPGFRANLNLSPQQTDTRLLGAVDGDLAYDTAGQMFNADDVGQSDPEDIVTRVPDTPDKFIAMSRRVGYFTPFEDSAWIDNVDKARELVDPTNKYMAAMMAGRWRKVDNAILTGGLGNAYAYTGPVQTGAPTASPLPASQVVGPTVVTNKHDAENLPTDGSQYGLSVAKLLTAKVLLDNSDLEGERYLAVAPQQIADMLARTPATSLYYQNVTGLMSGMLDSFLGFKIIRLPAKRFSTYIGHDGASAVRQCMAWIKPAIVYRGRPITDAQIWQRKDKSNTPQAFYKTEHGVCRRYDTGVVEIDCYEGPAY